MRIEQMYTGCLAQGAYYVESNGEALIIDPLREVDAYIKKAQRNGVKIKYVLETHFHADFVSGHSDLAQKTGAKIVFGSKANPEFEAHLAQDGEELNLGDIRLKVLHTPGHTLESVCYLLIDENGKNSALFTGDTLFLGDVGRPDLAIQSNITEKELAGMLYDSIQNKILVLEDEVTVYPAHGAGSACGKNMRKETIGLLGEEKRTNYALNGSLNREEFIAELTKDLLPPPSYFPQNALLNKKGSPGLDGILDRGLRALNPDAFEAAANEMDTLVLDTRSSKDFAQAHIPHSIFIGIDGGFAPWVGALISDIKQPILIVADKDRESEVITRLARVGYDNTMGYLEGGIGAWETSGREIDTIDSIKPEIFAEKYAKKTLRVVDVRKPAEFAGGHVYDAQNLPLDFINDTMAEFSGNETLYIHCAGGYRSMIASSILKARGFNNFVNVEQGFNSIKEKGVTVTAGDSKMAE